VAGLTFFAPGYSLTVVDMAFSVRITSPTNGATVSGNVQLTHTSTGPVKSVVWTVNGQVVQSPWQTGTTLVGADGPHTITLTGRDASGHLTRDCVTVTVHNNIPVPPPPPPPPPAAPTLSAVSPATGVQGATVQIILTGTNFIVGDTAVAITGTGVTVSHVIVGNSTSLTAQLVIDPAATADARTITVTTTVGTSGGETFTVTAPVLAVPTLTGFSPTQAVQGTIVPLLLTGTDFVIGATTVNVSGTGIAVSSVVVSGSTSLTCTFTIDAAASGFRSVSVTTVGGTSGAQTFTITVPAPPPPTDTTPPVVAITSPTSGAVFSPGEVTIIATATDTQSGVASVQFAVDGVALGAPHTTPPYQQVWTSTVGNHTVRATATDGAGNVAAASNTVSVQQAAPPPPPPPPPPPTAGVLQPSDFVFLGYYDLQTAGSNSGYAQGLTHRYVNGDLRLLIMQAGNTLHEISLAGRSYGDLIQTPTRQWTGFVGLADFKGFYWDETRGVLWSSTSYDYVADPPAPTQIYTHVLNDNQTLGAQVGPLSLPGVPAKRSYGGVQRLPAWFQTAYGVGPYAVGWGGYTSLMTAGGSASMGLTFYAFDPAGSVRILADHTPSFGACTATPGLDRGRRLTRPLNYFDSGGDGLPPGRPTVPPNQAGCWLSPQADGYGRFLWGDSYYQTGCWIETATKRGFITILCGGIGECWYQGSTLNFDGRIAELHIFDPAMLGEVALGTRNPCDTQPAYTAVLPLAGLNQIVIGNTTVGNAAAATFDASGQRLYVAGFQVGGPVVRVYVFSVDAGTTPDVILNVIAPFAGATVQGSVTVLAAHQGDVGGGVALWWRNAANTQSGGIGPELIAPPYQFQWDTTVLPNGDYYLHASSHATGSTAEVLVTLFNSGVIPTPGTVTIISPADNATVLGTILIHADTTGDLGGGLIFWWKSLDGSIQLTPGGEFHTGPYEVVFDTTQVPNGVYTLHAVTHATGDTPLYHITVAN